MPKQFETANITYKGLEQKGLTYSLIDENGKKWTIWPKDYNDKTKDSEVWLSLLGYQLGDTFGVSYKETEESFIGKEGKPITFKRKTIYSIMPPIANPTNTMQTSKPSQTQNSAPGQAKTENTYEQAKDETFWGKIGYKKCLWQYWLEKKGKATLTGQLGMDELAIGEMELVWHVFNQIEKDANKRFNQVDPNSIPF